MTGIYLVPYCYLVVAAALRRLDPSIEEASRVAGAGPLRTLLQVSLPAIRPAITNALVIAAVAGIGMFSVPIVLGTAARIEVLSVHRVPPARQLSAAHGLRTGTQRDADDRCSTAAAVAALSDLKRTSRGSRRSRPALRHPAARPLEGSGAVAAGALYRNHLRHAGRRPAPRVAAVVLDPGHQMGAAFSCQLFLRAAGERAYQSCLGHEPGPRRGDGERRYGRLRHDPAASSL